MDHNTVSVHINYIVALNLSRLLFMNVLMKFGFSSNKYRCWIIMIERQLYMLVYAVGSLYSCVDFFLTADHNIRATVYFSVFRVICGA